MALRASASPWKHAYPRRCPSLDLGGPGACGQPGAVDAAGVRARVHVQQAPEAQLAGPGLRACGATGEVYVSTHRPVQVPQRLASQDNEVREMGEGPLGG